MDTYTVPRGTKVWNLPINRRGLISREELYMPVSEYPESLARRRCEVVLRRPSTRHKCDDHDALILRPASFGESG